MTMMLMMIMTMMTLSAMIRKYEIMMIMPAKDNTDDGANSAKGDVINDDVIQTIPTSLMTFYDYNNDDN